MLFSVSNRSYPWFMTILKNRYCICTFVHGWHSVCACWTAQDRDAVGWGSVLLRSLQRCPNSLTEVRPCTGTPFSQESAGIPPHPLPGCPHKHLPSLFSSASSRITLPPVFPGYSCDCILLFEVEMLPASWKLLETGRPFMEMLTQLYL